MGLAIRIIGGLATMIGGAGIGFILTIGWLLEQLGPTTTVISTQATFFVYLGSFILIFLGYILIYDPPSLYRWRLMVKEDTKP